ncbi:phage tail protein [Moraxella nasovis]|uniref:phage tail protein n=1 Tax=Moraxella nasovis TaxID=2904121 RepID=UPI001F622245|nr:phage tail protein [Moraxella nasovis]UNU74103.1 phage tail protein [Moraxella nasovis]
MEHFDYRLLIDSVHTTTPKASVIKFGDGYEQVFSQGINTIDEKWSCKLQDTKSQIDNAYGFLIRTKGVHAFTIQPVPSEPVITVRLDGEISRSNIGGDVWQLSFNIRRVF